MIEDAELSLVFSRTKEVFAKSSAATDHLPKLRIGLYGFGEDQIDERWHIDACIQHIHGHGDGQIFRTVGGFEIIDELLRAGFIVVDA